MNSITDSRSKTLTNSIALIVFVVICLLVGAMGGVITASSVDTWYQTLQKPVFNPPDWLFAPVWSTLYLMMAVAGWRVWKRVGLTAGRRAFLVYGLQLVLNLVWSYLFFGIQRIDLALIEIVILLTVIIINMVMFWRIDRLAGILFIPYVLWVFFAQLLNFSLLMLNAT